MSSLPGLCRVFWLWVWQADWESKPKPKGWQQQQQQQQQQEGPLSFMEAWDSSFFIAPALLLLTTLAFVVNLVPTLDSGLEEYWQ